MRVRNKLTYPYSRLFAVRFASLKLGGGSVSSVSISRVGHRVVTRDTTVTRHVGRDRRGSFLQGSGSLMKLLAAIDVHREEVRAGDYLDRGEVWERPGFNDDSGVGR